MRKLLLALLYSMCIMPVFAQFGRGIASSVNVVGLADSVQRTAAQRLLQAGKPPQNFSVRVALPQKTHFLLMAQLVNSDKFLNEVFPLQGLRYLPKTFTDGTPSLFRGMSLSRVEDLKNILQKGLERNKSIYSALYFSGNIDEALSSAINEGPAIPVLIKVEMTSRLLRRFRSPYHDVADNYVFTRDLPSPFLTKVVVFLEVDGKPGWYEAVLENDELIFIPAVTDFFRSDSLPIHQFDVPNVNSWRNRWKKIFRF
ncbi:MAG: hypothetical protein IKP06_04090 [Elusimicrobiaceae bacterium]|nr:hypothetical protein [Elusimicrobiaceae bacterium]